MKRTEIPTKIIREFDKKIKDKKFAEAYIGWCWDEDEYNDFYKEGLGSYFEEWKDDNETFKIHHEIKKMYYHGYKNVTLNGFEESILYVIDRKYNDYEISKNIKGNYSTTFED